MGNWAYPSKKAQAFEAKAILSYKLNNPNNKFYQWLLDEAPKFHKSAYCDQWLEALRDDIATGTESDYEELNKKLPAKEDTVRGEDAAATAEEALAAPKAVMRTSVAALDDDDNHFAEEIWKKQKDPNVEHWRQSGSLTAATGSGTIAGLSHNGDINLHN